MNTFRSGDVDDGLDDESHRRSLHVWRLVRAGAANSCRDLAIFVMVLSEVFSYLDSLMSGQFFSTDLGLLFGFPIYCLAAELISNYSQCSLAAWLNAGPDSWVWRATGNYPYSFLSMNQFSRDE